MFSGRKTRAIDGPSLLRLVPLFADKVRITISRIDLPLARLQILLDSAESAQCVGVIRLNDPEQLVGRGCLRNHFVGLVDTFFMCDLGVVFVDLLLGAANPDAIGLGLGRRCAGRLGVDGDWVVWHGIGDWDGGCGHAVGNCAISHGRHAGLGSRLSGYSPADGWRLGGRADRFFVDTLTDIVTVVSLFLLGVCRRSNCRWSG